MKIRKKLTLHERGIILKILYPQQAYELEQNACGVSELQVSEYLDESGIPTESNKGWYVIMPKHSTLNAEVDTAIKKAITEHFDAIV